MLESNILIQNLVDRMYDEQLQNVYIDAHLIEYQRERYITSVKEFQKYFGEGKVEIYSTPGRSEVCGNHTDHQYGMVLATSINLDSIAVVSRNEEGIVRIKSKNYDLFEVKVEDLTLREEEKETSVSLVKGVLQGLKEAGYKLGGFNLYTTSDVLIGAGLSSSAAFEVLVGTVVSGLFNEMQISPIKLAQVAQYAENVYFGKPCGLMDQMACSVGNLIHIDFENPKNPTVHQVEIDFEKYKYSLCIVDTKGSHADLTEDYGLIPSEMKQVAQCMGAEVLRQVKESDFIEKIPEIREKVSGRAVLRALHFYQEEKNVEAAIKALENERFDDFLSVIKQSGNSSFKYLQNVYTNHDVNHQNMSIALALTEQFLGENGVCRVHGGGFAGTIQCFIKNEVVYDYKEYIERVFGKDSCHVLKVRKYGGIKVIS